MAFLVHNLHHSSLCKKRIPHDLEKGLMNTIPGIWISVKVYKAKLIL